MFAITPFFFFPRSFVHGFEVDQITRDSVSGNNAGAGMALFSFYLSFFWTTDARTKLMKTGVHHCAMLLFRWCYLGSIHDRTSIIIYSFVPVEADQARLHKLILRFSGSPPTQYFHFYYFTTYSFLFRC